MRLFLQLLFCFGCLLPLSAQPKKEIAVFAGGNFFYLQQDFEELQGVISTTAGYIGGSTPNPTYEDVSQGLTDYVEAVKVVYNPKRVSYYQLVNFYWKLIDPTRNDGQFCDIGPQFRPVIFYSNASEKETAEESKSFFSRNPKIQPINVEVRRVSVFYPAEDQYQQYYLKDPVAYNALLFKCGRAARLKEIWGTK